MHQTAQKKDKLQQHQQREKRREHKHAPSGDDTLFAPPPSLASPPSPLPEAHVPLGTSTSSHATFSSFSPPPLPPPSGPARAMHAGHTPEEQQEDEALKELSRYAMKCAGANARAHRGSQPADLAAALEDSQRPLSGRELIQGVHAAKHRQAREQAFFTPPTGDIAAAAVTAGAGAGLPTSVPASIAGAAVGLLDAERTPTTPLRPPALRRSGSSQVQRHFQPPKSTPKPWWGQGHIGHIWPKEERPRTIEEYGRYNLARRRHASQALSYANANMRAALRKASKVIQNIREHAYAGVLARPWRRLNTSAEDAGVEAALGRDASTDDIDAAFLPEGQVPPVTPPPCSAVPVPSIAHLPAGPADPALAPPVQVSTLACVTSNAPLERRMQERSQRMQRERALQRGQTEPETANDTAQTTTSSPPSASAADALSAPPQSSAAMDSRNTATISPAAASPPAAAAPSSAPAASSASDSTSSPATQRKGMAVLRALTAPPGPGAPPLGWGARASLAALLTQMDRRHRAKNGKNKRNGGAVGVQPNGSAQPTRHGVNARAQNEPAAERAGGEDTAAHAVSYARDHTPVTVREAGAPNRNTYLYTHARVRTAGQNPVDIDGNVLVDAAQGSVRPLSSDNAANTADAVASTSADVVKDMDRKGATGHTTSRVHRSPVQTQRSTAPRGRAPAQSSSRPPASAQRARVRPDYTERPETSADGLTLRWKGRPGGDYATVIINKRIRKTQFARKYGIPHSARVIYPRPVPTAAPRFAPSQRVHAHQWSPEELAAGRARAAEVARDRGEDAPEHVRHEDGEVLPQPGTDEEIAMSHDDNGEAMQVVVDKPAGAAAIEEVGDLTDVEAARDATGGTGMLAPAAVLTSPAGAWGSHSHAPAPSAACPYLNPALFTHLPATGMPSSQDTSMHGTPSRVRIITRRAIGSRPKHAALSRQGKGKGLAAGRAVGPAAELASTQLPRVVPAHPYVDGASPTYPQRRSLLDTARSLNVDTRTLQPLLAPNTSSTASEESDTTPTQDHSSALSVSEPALASSPPLSPGQRREAAQVVEGGCEGVALTRKERRAAWWQAYQTRMRDKMLRASGAAHRALRTDVEKVDTTTALEHEARREPREKRVFQEAEEKTDLRDAEPQTRVGRVG